MGVSHIYYADLENTRGRRQRVTFIAPSSTVLTPTLEPEWGEDPAPGSNFVRVPAAAITLGRANATGASEATPSASQAKFTGDLPWGIAETPTMPLAIAFRHLQSSANLRYLAGIIFDYAASGTTISYQTSYNGESRTVKTSVVVTVRDGVAGDAIADFTTRFQGVIRSQPGRKGRIVPGVGVTAEIELYHIARAVLESVTMADVGDLTLGTTAVSGPYGAAQSGSDGGGFVRVYDLTWKNGSDIMTWYHEPKDQRVRLYSRQHLMWAAQKLCTQVYAAFTRQTPDYSSWQFRFRGYREHATAYRATPWDHWTYYKQDHSTELATRQMAKGAALGGGESLFIGTVARTDVPTVYYAGLLLDFERDNSLVGLGTLWDFLAEACNDAACKGVTRQTASTVCEFWFLRIRESSQSVTSIALTDIKGKAAPTALPEPIEFDAGSVAVAGAEIAPRHVYDGEVETVVVGDATHGDGPMTLQTLWHTRPAIGDGVVATFPGNNGDYDCAGFAKRKTWPLWALYYVDTPSLFGGSLENAYRVHDAVTVDDGENEWTIEGSVASLPTTPELFGVPTAAPTYERDIRLAIIGRQSGSTNLYAVAWLARELFGPDREPTTYTLTLPDTLADVNRLGDRYDLGASASDLIATGETTLDALSGDATLVGVEVDATTNRATCTFLATT